jgi:hypothetical protein
MTGNEMISQLGMRMEDPSQENFTQTMKIDVLNVAQKTVVNLIHNAYLDELESIQDDVSISGGVVAYSSVFSTTTVSITGGSGSGATAVPVIRGGYVVAVTVTASGTGYATDPTVAIAGGGGAGATIAVTRTGTTVGSIAVSNPGNGSYSEGSPVRNGITAIYDETNNLFCSMIEAKDAKRLENSYLAGGTNNPVAYTHGQKIYVSPSTTALIDVWYLKEPTAIGADANEADLNVALHEVILDFAESQLWKMDAKNDRATSASASAMGQIEALNARYPSEAPKGIGTKNRV